MLITLKTKIWLTVISIVLMFTFFILFYFPEQQAKLILKNYNNEVQNLANTVALGVKIAITEQNFEGVQTAIEFVKGDPHLQFVSMLEYDTVWNNNHTGYQVKIAVFKTFPENQHPSAYISSNDSIIVKKAPFKTAVMSGAILLGFTTREIMENKQKIKATALMVSGIVLFIGIVMGFWLARKISVPVLALRNAAIRVGEGDLTQRVDNFPNDEIGELGKAFNTMVNDLSRTSTALSETNKTLSNTNNALNTTLLELKAMQNQLIQAEKMASLGELTAGIAHEIQNPLNFVNNFAEVSIELLEEMKAEMQSGNEEDVIAIAGNIAENLKRINHHGKRADAIVKGMLQHSRKNTGQKEPTDINALADEYMRLSYHGLRAKDKLFNATIQTDFDDSIRKINIVPQDMGRVLLNLFNNAFYAVSEKKKQADEKYQPIVTVSTKKLNNKIEICVNDNGNGIPQYVADKIFQPFFTTKPTGQGTGLGLSLSNDIITKVHGGTIKVETKEGEGAKFIVLLPALSE